VKKQRKTRWPGHVARIEETENAHETVAGKPEGNKPFGRSRLRTPMLKCLSKKHNLWVRARL
jgi:hypothetical protein